MKVINNARSLLIEAVDAQPEPADTYTGTSTKDGDPRHKGRSSNPPVPRRRTFSGHRLAEFEMKFDIPIDPDIIDREDFAQSKSGNGYEPTEGEYRDLLQDIANLHAAVCRIADAIENLTHTRSCMIYWDHIWLTFHMAGATTEGIWDIVRYTWHEMLQRTGRLGPGEWGTVEVFVTVAKAAISKCDRIISGWEPHGERESCFRLYKALRQFPIAKMKTRDPSWQAQDRLMRGSILVYEIEH
ncbi:hypothetical protein F4820DRAFT_364169 [Hypoxylon rubiginosum]|uniref:Uncharacterized protein n=1 Tax=Hypoxylon rubiginosum TaxID=110542 RepID=A0ACB9ZDH4_9PEZI|nr:hypothetical protein F4820DRAFT_364169 [Hypoxylon rubiginosum]